MKLKCHAVLKSGEMCGKTASTTVNGLPACGLTPHYFGRSEFFPMTEESVYPEQLESARVALEFFGGADLAALARKYGKTTAEVEDLIRAAAAR